MAKITTITNPLTGQPAQVDQLEHTAQEIDDAIARALPGGAIDMALQNKTPILQEISVITLRPEDMNNVKNGSIRLSKIGNMVMFSMNINPESGAAEYNKTYAVLPEGYRPAFGFTFPADSGLGESIYMEMDAAGNVRTYSSRNVSFLSAELMYFSV